MALQRIAGRVGFQANEKVDQLDRNVAGSKDHCGTLQLSYMMSRGQQVEHHAQGFRVEKPRCQFVCQEIKESCLQLLFNAHIEASTHHNCGLVQSVTMSAHVSGCTE